MKSVKGAKKALKKLLGSTPMMAKHHTPVEYKITDRDGVVDDVLSAATFKDAVERNVRNRKMEVERLTLKASGKKPPRKVVAKKVKSTEAKPKKSKKSKKGKGNDEE